MRTVSNLVLGGLLQEMLQDCEGSFLTDSVFPVKLGVSLCFTAALVEDEFAGSWDSAAPHWVMDWFVQARVPTVLCQHSSCLLGLPPSQAGREKCGVL